MPTKDENGHWINPTGEAVPPKYVPPQDKLRDKLVEKYFAKAVKANEQLAALKRDAHEAIDAYLTTLFEKYDAKPNERGNYTLTGFSGDKQVIVKIQRYLEFDEQIEVAKQLVDQCLEEWSNAADADNDALHNLSVIANDAFRVRGKQGLDVKSILRLRTYKIKDKTGRWQRAMDLIGESLYVGRSRAYLQFKHRPTLNDDWQAVPLDIAAVR